MKHSGHRLLFRLKCLDTKDTAFQKLFERIMQKYDKAFMPVKPAGPEGDWKCDGYSASSQTVYQCYAPNELRSGKTKHKIRDDFAGAEQRWGARMKHWTFVWNADALPPQVVALLAEITEEYKGRITVSHLGPEQLWDEIVSQLSRADLDELLGEVPVSSDLTASQLRLAVDAFRRGEMDTASELCREVLTTTKDDRAQIRPWFEACNLLVASALRKNDLTLARRYSAQASERLDQDVPPMLRAHFFQSEGALLLRERRESEAETAFLRGLEVRSAPGATCGDDQGFLEDVHCLIRSDLVLYLAQTKQTQRALAHADAAETYITEHPATQDGHLLPFVVDSLVSLAARLRDPERANRALQLLDEHCSSHEQAGEGTRVLQRLTGRAAHLGATDIALACSDMASRLAQRAELTEGFWISQFNTAVTYLQMGNEPEAQKRLQTLWPLLDSDAVPDPMKAAFLSLASTLAGRHGDHEQAVALQQRLLAYVGMEPFGRAACSFSLGRALHAAGRIAEAADALEAAARIGRASNAPGEFLFEVLATSCECEAMLGRWETADTFLEELRTLPRPDVFDEGVLSSLQQQLDGTKEMRRRIEEISRIIPAEAAPTLLESNALLFRPLLEWWREVSARATDKPANDPGLRILYDYWGGGGAVEVMANLRRFSPDHFSPFVEVRSVADIRRAIRMFSLVSDTLVLLWKGRIESEQVLAVVPVDHVKGGAGYILSAGDTGIRSAVTGPWWMAIGQGAYLPEEVCTFLATEAAPLLALGRILLLPAPAVGCWQAQHGPCESLLVEAMGASLLLNRGTTVSKFPVGMVPFFEDAPLTAIADLLGEHPEQTRRLRLALLKKTRELRAHGSPEAASRELRDEIADALAEWNDTSQQVARKHRWRSQSDELAAATHRFQSQWWPVFTLSRLGYRWSIDSVDDRRGGTSAYRVEKGTPLGTWLMRPGEGLAFLTFNSTDSEAGESTEE